MICDLKCPYNSASNTCVEMKMIEYIIIAIAIGKGEFRRVLKHPLFKNSSYRKLVEATAVIVIKQRLSKDRKGKGKG